MKTLLATALAAALVLGFTTPAQAAPAVVTFAYAGDSTSLDKTTWRGYVSAATVEVGGYARGGYTSGQVLAHIKPVPKAQVLEVMIGINDIRRGVKTSTTIANIRAIVKKVGAKSTVLSAIAPSDLLDASGNPTRRDQHNALNEQLKTLAAYHGWAFVDPYAALRTTEGGWVAGYSDDGVHANLTTAPPIIGASISRKIHMLGATLNAKSYRYKINR